MTLSDKQRGCLIGLAVGDALGAAVEFKRPGTFAPVAGYRAGGPHGLAPGEWTDDTSMALALADSIGQQGWDLDDQARRYVAWWRTGAYSVNDRCFDIGITTRSALSRFQQTGKARTCADPSSEASGNGSIMRLAPVPIHFVNYFPDQIESLARLAAESSLPTHASPQCLSACRYMALILAGLMHGLDRETVLSPNWEPLQRLYAMEPLHPEVAAVAEGSFRTLAPPAIQGSGYVVKSLEAALWAFHKARNFEEAVLAAVNLGDDADTTGAVCGQFAGALWGESGIPPVLREGLARKDLLEQAFSSLVGPSAAKRPAPAAQAEWRPPTKSCYWVVPGRLLAGAYPGDRREAMHRQKVSDLVAAGVRVFLNLMEAEERNLDGEAFTPYENLVRELAPEARMIRFPIRDLSVPTPGEMSAVLNAIDESLDAGSTVYIHCWGGVGRTGTVIGCWLQRHALAEPSTVLDVLAQLRQHDQERRDRLSPETPEQLRFVQRWLAEDERSKRRP